MKSSLIYFAAAIGLFLGSSVLPGQGIVVKAGINYTDLNEKTDINYSGYSARETIETNAGYNFGFNFDLLAPIGEAWSLSLAPYFTHYQMDIKLRVYSSADSANKIFASRISDDYIHIPLNFKYLYNISEWRFGAFMGMGPGFCVSNSTWSPFTVNYNIGILAGYKRIIAEAAYFRTGFVNSKGDDRLSKFNSFIFNVGYVLN